MRGCFLHSIYGSHGKFEIILSSVNHYQTIRYFFHFVESSENVKKIFFDVSHSLLLKFTQL